MRALVAEALRGAEFEVHSCASSSEAVTVFAAVDPDVVVTDIDLGTRPNGVELAHIVKASGSAFHESRESRPGNRLRLLVNRNFARSVRQSMRPRGPAVSRNCGHSPLWASPTVGPSKRRGRSWRSMERPRTGN